jgi:hypothetical protein
MTTLQPAAPRLTPGPGAHPASPHPWAPRPAPPREGRAALPVQRPVDRPAAPASATRAPARPAVPAARPALRRASRDPFVDGVRTIGTLLVVALHWLMVEAVWDGEHLAVGNALGHGWAWLLTWAQPLPLLFFAAGAAARYGLVRRPQVGGWRFAGARLPRMALPVAVLVGTWALLTVVLPHLGVPAGAVQRAARIVPQPLWFLGVQLALLALTPWLLRLLRRHGLALPVVLAGLALAVDVVRFGQGIGGVGYANLLLVWAVPYLGGLVYADRRLSGDVPLPRLRGLTERGLLGLLALGGLVGTVVLLMVGPYPVSLIGMPGDAISNLAPPTAPVVTFAVAQVAAALLLRDAVGVWAGRSRLVAWVDARSMGLYLWHLSAMFLVSGVVLLGVGRALPEPWTWDWWTTRAGYLGAAALVLALLVALADRVERAVRPSRARRA